LLIIIAVWQKLPLSVKRCDIGMMIVDCCPHWHFTASPNFQSEQSLRTVIPQVNSAKHRSAREVTVWNFLFEKMEVNPEVRQEEEPIVSYNRSINVTTPYIW